MDRGRKNLVVNTSGKKDIIMVLGEIDPAPLWRQI
jgi:hypothetical protein